MLRPNLSVKKLVFFVIFLWRVVVSSPKSYPIKENLIGSVVSEILRYKHTVKQKAHHIILVHFAGLLASHPWTRQSCCQDGGSRLIISQNIHIPANFMSTMHR